LLDRLADVAGDDSGQDLSPQLDVFSTCRYWFDDALGGQMDVKEAVSFAKDYVAELFAGENVLELGLEEVEKIGDFWYVTIGFRRPWQINKAAIAGLGYGPQQRSYKVVKLNDTLKEVESVKDRELKSALT
jgi:hypothetical protein